MAKNDKKKHKKPTSKAPAKKVSKKPAPKKVAKPKVKKVIKPKPKKDITPKPKKVAKPKKAATKEKKVVKEAKASKSAQAKVAKKKGAPVKPLPPVEEKKPKGGPRQLSMALEEKETTPVITKPRITRSKSGNLLFQLEYTIRSSPGILFEFLTTPSGMAQWFAESVDIEGHHCTFVWEGYEEYATIIDSIPDEYIRYRWDNSDEDEYFEFRISKNEITSDTILTVTDFASEQDMNGQKLLWDSQIKMLVQQVGG